MRLAGPTLSLSHPAHRYLLPSNTKPIPPPFPPDDRPICALLSPRYSLSSAVPAGPPPSLASKRRSAVSLHASRALTQLNFTGFSTTTALRITSLPSSSSRQ